MRTLLTFASHAPLPLLLLKVTLVLGLGATVSVLLTRASAASRHFVWAVTLMAVVVLAVMTPVVPSFVVRVPTAFGRLGLAAPEPGAELPSSTVRARDALVSNIMHARWAVGDESSARSTTTVGPLRAEPSPDGKATWDNQRILGTAIAAWLIGALLILLWSAAGHLGLAQLIAASEPVRDVQWQHALHRAETQLGVRRTVRLLVHGSLSAPITAGWFRPAILLPEGFDSWTSERRDVVLMHELAHVERSDYVTQLVATVACSLFWFHPGVWMAAARLRAESERAADDHVLNVGMPAEQYARHLLALADHSGRLERTPAFAIGLARPSQLEGRLRAMLDTSRSRSRLPHRMQRAIGSVTLMALVPVAAVQTETAAEKASSSSFPAPSTLAAVPDLPTPASAAAASGTRSPSTAEQRSSAAMSGSAAGSPNPMKQQASQADSIIDQTVSARDGETLTLDLATGGDITIRASNEPRVRLHAVLGGTSWRDTHVEFDRTGNGVRLRTAFGNTRRMQSSSHRFELWVPRHTNVELSSSGGSVAIRDVTGDFRGHTGGGEITIRNAQGSASLTTGGGDISVSASDLRGTVGTGGGRVVLASVTGGLRGSSGTGEVYRSDSDIDNTITVAGGSTYTVQSNNNVRLSDGSRLTRGGFVNSDGSVNVRKSGGDVTVADAPRGGTINTGGGMVSVGSSGGATKIVTGGGNVELQRMGGDADVTTGAGDIFIRIVNTDGSAHSVIARTGSGHVTIEIPNDLDARVDLETAYTESYLDRMGHGVTIKGDFGFNPTESSTFEGDGRMTPRKIVRGSLIFGRGRGHIEIYAVNGDITVRRSR